MTTLPQHTHTHTHTHTRIPCRSYWQALFIYLDYYSADQENLALAVHDELVLTSSAVQEEITIGACQGVAKGVKG